MKVAILAVSKMAPPPFLVPQALKNVRIHFRLIEAPRRWGPRAPGAGNTAFELTTVFMSADMGKRFLKEF